MDIFHTLIQYMEDKDFDYLYRNLISSGLNDSQIMGDIKLLVDYLHRADDHFIIIMEIISGGKYGKGEL